MQAFKLSADNKLGGSSPFKSTGHGVYGYQKEHKSLIHLTTEPFSILPQTILDEFWFREDGSISGLCSHIAPSLNDTSVCKNANISLHLCIKRSTVFTESDI